MRLHLVGLGLALAVTVTVPAMADYPACTKTVTPSDSELAHQKYIAGKQDYDEASYETSLRRFREAYALDCTKHELLVIIATAYERKGDKKEAVNALETFIARSPSSPDLQTYQTKVDNLKKALADEAAAAAPAPKPQEPTQEHSVYPWLVVGAGVVTLGVGVAIFATAPDYPKNCNQSSEKCTQILGESSAQLQSEQDQAGRAKGQPLAGGITMAIGGALIVGGLVWHFVEPTGPKDRARLQPAVGPGFAGLSFGDSF